MANQRPIPKPATNQVEPERIASRFPRIMLSVVITISILVFAFVTAAKYFGSYAIKSGSSEDTSIRQIIVGNDVLNIPANVFRFKEQRQAITAKQLDLFFHWPDFKGYSLARHELFYGQAGTPGDLIFVTINNRKISLDMSERFKPVYLKLLEGKAAKSALGLVFQRLKPEAGYSGEELHYQTGVDLPYVVRCQRQKTNPPSASCMRDINIGKGLSVTYRFSRKLLPNWRPLEETIRNLTVGYLSN